MGKRLRKLKKIRLHHEGTSTLVVGFIVFAALNALVYYLTRISCPMVGYTFAGITTIIYLVIVNFFRCPIRHYEDADTDGLIIAPADGKVVVIEEVEENEYFHDRRLMVSIFILSVPPCRQISQRTNPYVRISDRSSGASSACDMPKTFP